MVGPRYNEDHEYENLINEIRVEQGMTLKQLASMINISQSYMWNITQGYAGPYNYYSGRLKNWAIKIQEVFGYDLSEIFPREVCNIETSNLTDYQLTYIAQGYEGDYYTDMETKLDRHILKQVVNDGIKICLTTRERAILNLRFKFNQTLEEAGSLFSLSRDRIRQLEARSLRILRGYTSKVYNNDSSIYARFFNERMADLKRKREVAVAYSNLKL